MSPDSIKNLTDHLSSQRADINIVTGDLVNLALPKEVEAAAKWLRRLGTSQQVCMVPGNHDAYLPGSLNLARKTYGAYACGETLDQSPYPFVRRVGNVAIVGCSSAIATPPFIAAGYFDKQQGERLAKCLRILKEAGFFRIIAIHHPPIRQFVRPYRKALYGAKLFRQIIASQGAELVLHGHTHKSSIHMIKGTSGNVPVIGVAAASTNPASLAAPARYNLFQVEKLQNRWSCTMREFGYQRVGENIVQRLQLRIY